MGGRWIGSAVAVVAVRVRMGEGGRRRAAGPAAGKGAYASGQAGGLLFPLGARPGACVCALSARAACRCSPPPACCVCALQAADEGVQGPRQPGPYEADAPQEAERSVVFS